ncbi:MAG: beta-lactamase family protein [Euzebyales bacterium]|nr:beta-lactamase family protein [Euzebyales bacterium]
MTERTHGRRRWVVLATGALVGLIAGTLLAPRPPQLSAEVGGDAELAADARSAAGDPIGLERLVVARVADGEIVTAALGGGRPEQRFEIGSIAKVLTGILLADLAAEGVVSRDEPVSALLPGVPFSDPNVASITLQRLATHHSGLPRLIVSDPRDVIGVVTQNLGADPYLAQGPQAILDDAASVSAGDPAYRYSNFGSALLGQALAARAQTPFAELLRERVLDPLGMDDTTIVSADGPLPEWAVPGRSAGGSARAPWRSTGHAPAGGAIWSTAGDLPRLLAATADGSAPGAEAAEPRADAGGDGVRVGLGWITSDKEGRAITWHNGGRGASRRSRASIAPQVEVSWCCRPPAGTSTLSAGACSASRRTSRDRRCHSSGRPCSWRWSAATPSSTARGPAPRPRPARPPTVCAPSAPPPSACCTCGSRG